MKYLFACIVSLFCATAVIAQTLPLPNVTAQQYFNVIAQSALQTQARLPIQIDSNTTLVELSFEPTMHVLTRHLKISSRIVNPAEALNRMQRILISGNCTTPVVRMGLNYGIILVYQYYTEDMRFIGLVRVDQASCFAPPPML